MSRKKREAAKIPPPPRWVKDLADQRAWDGRFLAILERDYKNLDPTISAILSDERLARMCAVKIRSYVEVQFTKWLYGQRKARGIEHKMNLKTAIAGLNAAASLYSDRGNQGLAMHLASLAIELSGELGRCKLAFGTKRHGRDRAHSTLKECHLYLESQLRKHVTNETLTTLVNAGFEADGDSFEPITEESIRKNLSKFQSNNPVWRNAVVVARGPQLGQPETK